MHEMSSPILQTVKPRHLYYKEEQVCGVRRSAPVPGTPEAVVPDRVFRATSTCFLWKPMSMSCRTMGSGGTGEAFCFLRRGGRTCCTVTGVEASLELLSSNRGEDGWVDSTARYWHTASAAA